MTDPVLKTQYTRFARRVETALALLFVALLGLGFWSIALQSEGNDLNRKAGQQAQEIKDARAHSIILSCEEQNARHATAKAGIEALAAKLPADPRLTPKERQERLDLFVDSITPAYLAGKGKLQDREAAGCQARLAKFSTP